MKRILVQIDGSNFYNRVKNLLPDIHLTNYKYYAFIASLIDNPILDITYYVGEIKRYPGNPKSQILYSNQQSLFSNLRSQDIKVEPGYLLRVGDTYFEKGVDVRIAVDMVKSAIKNLYDECYLISSDTDLIPGIKDSRLEGMKVVYVGFDAYLSKALRSNCDRTLIIYKNMISKFM